MKKKMITIDYDRSIQEAIEKIILNKCRTIFVIKKNKVIGTISEGDILRSLFEKKALQTPLLSITNKTFKFLDEKNNNISAAKKIFKQFSVLIIPVLSDKGELVSYFSIKDVI